MISMSTILDRRRAEIGLVIRDLRKSRDLTQAALAAKLGISQGALCDWETGRRSPAITDLPALAVALKVRAAALAKIILENIAKCD